MQDALVEKIRDTEFAAIDFEAAGARAGASDEPVQIGIALMHGGRATAEGGLKSYLACASPVIWSARRVHGIRDEDLLGAPSLTTLWPEIRKFLGGRWVVAHGAGTERRFLRAFPFHGFGPWVDTLKLARALDPDQPSHALGDLASAYHLVDRLRGMVEGFRWHDAFCDALASLLLLEAFIDRFDLADRPAELLLRADDSGYHRSRGKTHAR